MRPPLPVAMPVSRSPAWADATSSSVASNPHTRNEVIANTRTREPQGWPISPEASGAPSHAHQVLEFPAVIATIAGRTRSVPGKDRVLEIRDEASADLARIRRSIQTLRERLAQKLESLARGLGIAESFVTLREGRYAIAVPASHRRQVPGVALGYSGSGATVFLEPREAAEANSQLADLFADEIREVSRILRELSALARRDREALERDLGALARLDAAQAGGGWAEAVQGTMPSLSEESSILLLGGRHPLLL